MTPRINITSSETREKILDSAEWCYSQKGVSQTTLSDIAKKAGYTRGAIYWYFSSRDELLRTVIDRGKLDILTRLEFISKTKKDKILPELIECLHQCIHDAFFDSHTRNIIEIIFHRCDTAEIEKIKSISPLLSEQEKILSTLTAILKKARINNEITNDMNEETFSYLIYFFLIGLARSQIITNKDMLSTALNSLNLLLKNNL
ncbi:MULTISPECIES: TetR family transcriptional regulator [Providencia]|uniref:TetR family transcriptional regulator n=1 Tax=Providencia huaxiensis TaxID=2027290 RepID=A0ABU2IS55_9GAMM|nr:MULTISPECIES: TetR family transcriptional regulator [Providencia]MBZ3680825.1 TetR family transcriptional regulator [Providencia rettgeri]AXH63327.1 TetR family transcriptional regulator [Providencia huaxiensis]MDT0131865.1 TetR family transcriptional regulator [Providencia huaxiensis]MDT1978271.1 TetR family transcriptional regulator [Providencia huaxiensis]QLR01416.1 TetR family transcriptional regulator [Providencia rettgeri]